MWSDPDSTVHYFEEWETEADVRRRVRSERFTSLLAVLETAQEPPEEAFAWTRGPATAPAQPALLRIGFEAGLPVSVDGKALAPAALIRRVGEVAGLHGVGRIDLIVAAVEGAVILSRAARSTKPLDHVSHHLEQLIAANRPPAGRKRRTAK